MQRTRRRDFLLAASALAAAPLARAQKPGEKRVLGVLSPHPKPPPEQVAYFGHEAKLRELGWRIGENLILERPEDPRGEAALAEMAEGLVRKRVDAIFAIGPEAAVAAARATRTIPIIFWGVPHPVEQGLIASFARPGGNVTGVAFFTGAELGSKLVETFREVAPHVTRISALVTPSAASVVQGGQYLTEAGPEAAKLYGIDYRTYRVAAAAEIDAALDSALGARAQGIIAFGTTTTWRQRHRIAEFALRHRLISASNQDEFVLAGCLFSYSADTRRTFLQAIACVAKVLAGARPADIPVERPDRYELAFNLRTARALGVTIPDLLLLRAEKVIS
jgi:putative tryptophan/tyrosine transport system substrate-binding protein